MRWAYALGWFWVTAVVWAGPPMDLDSPFPKVALIRAKTGEIEKREIKEARLVGSTVEIKKNEGGVAIFPLGDVVAILPYPPAGEVQGTVRQIEAVLTFLQDVSPELRNQAGWGEKQLQDLRNLRDRVAQTEKQKEEQERQIREARSEKELRDWMTQASELRKPRTEKELNELRRSGETLAQANPARMDAILEVLAALSQVQPKEKGEALPELGKEGELQLRLVPDDFLVWLVGGIFLISFFALLFGLAFLSSSLTRFKEGALLGGVVFGILAFVLLGLLIWTWLPLRMAGQPENPRSDPKMAELGIYLRNRVKPVYYFPSKTFSVSKVEWRSGVLAYLRVAEEPVGLFKVKMREGALWLGENTWTWQQSMTALGIPLPLSLTLEGENPDLREWENPAIVAVSLGRWSLPDFLASPVKDSASSIWQQGLSSAGLTGVKLEPGGQGEISISVPASGVRPKYEFTEAEEKKKTAYRREITAEELARAFQEGQGGEFFGKFVVLDGVVRKVSSGSEFSGSTGVSPTDTETGAGKKIGPERLDVFYLAGTDRHGSLQDPLLVRCLVKSPLVFAMDSHGDVYVGPTANSVRDRPLIKKGYRVRFMSEGRVQSREIKNNEIEVYGIEIGSEGDLQTYDPNQPGSR